MSGTVRMILDTPLHPSLLKDGVTSKPPLPFPLLSSPIYSHSRGSARRMHHRGPHAHGGWERACDAGEDGAGGDVTCRGARAGKEVSAEGLVVVHKEISRITVRPASG